MKIAATALALFGSVFSAAGDVSETSASKAKIVSAFEERLDEATDCFMICVFDVIEDPVRFHSPDHLQVTGTVVKVFKGGRAIGDKFDYSLYVGGPVREAPDDGALLLIQIVPDVSRSTGRETRIFPFKPSVYEAAQGSAKQAEQDGAGEPATRAESDSEDGDKPQPEAEVRSR